MVHRLKKKAAEKTVKEAKKSTASDKEKDKTEKSTKSEKTTDSEKKDTTSKDTTNSTASQSNQESTESGSGNTAAATGKSRIATDGTPLNLRASSDANSNIIGSIGNCQSVTVLETVGGMTHIRTAGGQEAWVASAYVAS